jgi:hypothetical protein
MRFAIMTAAGSRGRDTGIWRDLGVRTVARLAGFPTIISPISTTGFGRPVRPTTYQASDSFQFER